MLCLSFSPKATTSSQSISWSFAQATAIKDEVIASKSDLKDAAEKKADEMPSHVMISYNTASRDLCLKIKADIEAAGHKVWIDVNDIHGSSLNSMAEAVENSYCVLICVTEKYRQSINCQAEAQYAFRINKPIVPLIMQSGYEKVKGWLGLILGDKIFINFTRYKYEECLKRLKAELGTARKLFYGPLLSITPKKEDEEEQKVPIIDKQTDTKTKSKTQIADVPKEIANTESGEVEKWSELKVLEWFEKNSLNLKIIETLGPCNGMVLTYQSRLSSCKLHNAQRV